MKQEFKVGDRVYLDGDSHGHTPGVVCGVASDAGSPVALVQWQNGVALSHACQYLRPLPSPPAPYETAASDIADLVEGVTGVWLEHEPRIRIADILRSHFPDYAEMRAVVDAARKLCNTEGSCQPKWSAAGAVADAVRSLDAKEADRG